MVQYNFTKKSLGNNFCCWAEGHNKFLMNQKKQNKTEMTHQKPPAIFQLCCSVFFHSPAGTSGPSAQWSSLTSAFQLFHPTPSFLLDRRRHGTRWGTDQRAVWHPSVYLSWIWFIKRHSARLPFFLCAFRSYAPWLRRFFISSSCPPSAGFWRRRGSRTWLSRAASGIA